jgi:glycosyltransferase involved in cell wall biosynthesis
MASFRLKFEQGIQSRGIIINHDLSIKSDAVLVIAGTRNLWQLQRARKRGVRIVQRLDGINWVQRVRWSGLRYTLRAEYGNLLLSFLRDRLADRVIYQSEFICRWWKDWYGAARVPESVILNGVDLDAYKPVGQMAVGQIAPFGDATATNLSYYRLLVVEGSLAGGLDRGLQAAVQLAEILSAHLPVKLTIAGVVDRATVSRFEQGAKFPVEFLGAIPREQIPGLMRSAHLLFSAEINPPCPNSVIEALACGLPVVGFDTGSLRELLGEAGGKLVPYGGNPWKLEPPDVPALAGAALEVLQEQERFRKAARARAEEVLSLDRMVDEYLKVLLDDYH